MKGKNAIAVILSVLFIQLLLISNFSVPHVAAQQQKPWEWKWEPVGPRDDRFLFKILKNIEARLVAFEANEIDVVGLRATDVDRIKKNRPDAFLLETEGLTMQAIQFNIRKTCGKDTCPAQYKAVRIAISHLLDREGYVVPEVLKGFGVPVYSLIPPTFGKWVNPNVKTYPFDVRKAEQVLDAAGIVKGPDGARIDPATGKAMRPIEILSLPPESAIFNYPIAVKLVEDAKKIGLPIEVKVVSSSLLDQVVTEDQKYDAYILGWIFGIYPTYFRLFWHSREDILGGFNENGVNDPELDKALDDFFFTSDINEAIRLHQKAQEILMDKYVPWAPLYTPITVTAVSGRIRGLVLAKVPQLALPVGRSILENINVHLEGQPFGGVFRQPIGIDITTLNPTTFLWADENTIISSAFEVMATTNPDDVYSEFISRLEVASSKEEVQLKPGQKGLKMTMKIASNATWHDGLPVTTDDLRYTIEELGQKLKLRRFRDEWILKTISIEQPDKQTLTLTVNGTSWTFFIFFRNSRFMPKHIFEQLKDTRADISKIAHPTKKGLTMLVGNGPYVVSEVAPGSHVASLWYPQYFKRHPEKGLKLETLKLPGTVYSDEPLEITLKLSDYLGNTVVNGTIVLQVVGSDGKVVKEATAINIGQGVYRFSVTGLDAGSYQLVIRAEQQLLFGSLAKNVAASLTVDPVWKRYQWLIAVVVIVAVIAVAVVFYRRRQKREEPEPEAPPPATAAM